MHHRDIFLAALDLPATERGAYLDRACADDGELRRLVEELLLSNDEAGSFLEHPAVTDETRTVGERAAAAEPTPATDGGAAPADDLSFLAPSPTPGSLGRLGHYDVREVVGQGGMGLVLRAFDEKLHRIVAVKVLAPALAASGTARQRFSREARAAAAVSHDHVVAIYAVEDDGPIAYLVMQMIDGLSLEEKVRQRGPLSLKEILRIGMQTAAGLAAAHKQGLVHRDIKPGNILLENGVERVKITDFGLARAVDDASVTQSGVIAGTPLYMSPEQARGEMVDHRSDLFSLGSVLYTLCTGRPAFRAGNTMAVLRRVCEEEPRPIHEVNAEVPDWLGAIVAKLMAKDPAERFQSAGEVSDLLGQHLAHLQQPGLAARPQTVAVPRPRQPRRLPVLAVVAVVVMAGLVVLTYRLWHSAGPDRSSVTPEQPKPFVPRPPLTPEELAKLPSPLDDRKRDDIRPDLLALAGGGDPAQAPPELVAVLGDGRFVLPGEGLTSWMAQSPDGKLLAVPRGSNVVLFDAGTGAVVRTLVGRGGRASAAAFSPDSTRLASGNHHGDGAVTVWDVQTGQVVHVLKGHTSHVWRTAFSGDGKRLVSGSWDRTAKVWDAEKGVELFTLSGHQDVVYTVAFSPDGRWALSGSHDGTVKVWDARTGQESKTLPMNGDNVWSLVYSPDGKLLAGGGWKGWKLWDAKTFEEVRSGAETAAWLAFSADSRVLLTGRHDNRDGTTHAVARWDVASGDKLGTLPLKSAGGYAFYALSPDAKTLFAMGGDPPDPFVRSYDAENGKELFPHQGHTGKRVWTVAFSPDGKTVASAGEDGTVLLWDLAGWKPGEPLPPIRNLPGHTATVWSVAFSPDGKLLASGSHDGVIILWDVGDGLKVRTLPGRQRGGSVAAFSPDGKTLAVGWDDGAVRRWDVATGTPQDPLRWHDGKVSAVAFSPDGRFLASKGGAADQTVCLADVATGQLLHTFRNPTPVKRQPDFGLAFSRDSRTLAITSEKDLRLCDLETKEETILSGHTDWLHGVAFHPAGRLLATTSDDHTVRLWDRSSPGRVLTIGPGPFGQLAREVAFDPTGRYLATSNWNGTVSILRTPEPPKPYEPGPPKPLPDPKELANRPSPADALKRDDIHPGQRNALPPEVVAVLGGPAFALPEGDASWMAVSADGKMLAVPCGDKVAVFDAHSGKRLRVLTGHTSRVFRVAFSPDGKRLVAGNRNPNVPVAKVWDLGTGEQVQEVGGHTDVINAVAFSPDGKQLVTASNDGTAKLFEDGKGIELKGHTGAIYAVAFAPDGKRLVTAGEDKTLRVWDATTGKEVKSLGGHGQGVMNVAFSPDGKLLASGTEEEWKLWDADALKEVRTVAGSAGWLAFAPDGKSLLGGAHNNSAAPDAGHVVKRWSLEGKELASFELKGKGGWAAYALSPDGKTLFEVTIHTGDSALRTYDAETGAERAAQGHAGRLITAAVSPDGKSLASAGEDSLIKLWDLATGELGQTLRGHRGAVHGVAFSPDGQRLASQGEDGTLRLWDPARGKGLTVLGRDKADGWGLAFSPDGRWLASASRSDGGVYLWDVAAGKLVRVFRGHQRALRLAFSPDARLLAGCGFDTTVRVWDVADGWEVRDLSGPGKYTSSVAFSPDGRSLATGGDDGTVKLWDVTTGGEVGSPWKFGGQVDGIVFGPDGRLLAAASYDGTVRLRDLSARPPRERTLRLPAGCKNLVLTPEGRYLAVPGQDGSVYVLRLAERGKVFEIVDR